LARLEKLAGDDFCRACMMLQFRWEEEPGRPEVCPECGRGPDDADYFWPDGSPKIREIVICSAQERPDGGNGAPPPAPEPHDQAGKVACVPVSEADVT
jgi:hypothetical protein